MIRMKIVAAAVAALCVCGAAAAIFWPDDDDGWYAWGPTVGDIDYSKISATPRIIDAIEQMYGLVHGDIPDPVIGYRVDFETLVRDTDDGICIKSSGTGAGAPDGEVFFSNNEIERMKIISYGSGFTDSYVQMLGENVWDTVVAAGNSTWNAYPDNDMRWNETLASEMTLNIVNLLTFLESDAFDENDIYCLVVWGYLYNYPAVEEAIKGIDNVKILCIDYYRATGSLNNLLSVVDALGRLVGIDTEHNDSLTDLCGRLGAIKGAVGDGGPKVYMELSNGRSPGSGTLTQLCFDVLGLKNINYTAGTNEFSDVSVVKEMPAVIFFDVNDTRTMEQKMRVVK